MPVCSGTPANSSRAAACNANGCSALRTFMNAPAGPVLFCAGILGPEYLRSTDREVEPPGLAIRGGVRIPPQPKSYPCDPAAPLS